MIRMDHPTGQTDTDGICRCRYLAAPSGMIPAPSHNAPRLPAANHHGRAISDTCTPAAYRQMPPGIARARLVPRNNLRKRVDGHDMPPSAQ